MPKTREKRGGGWIHQQKHSKTAGKKREAINPHKAVTFVHLVCENGEKQYRPERCLKEMEKEVGSRENGVHHQKRMTVEKCNVKKEKRKGMLKRVIW